MARTHLSPSRHALSSLVVLAVCSAEACDPSEGPREVGEVLGGEQKSYIEGPGERIRPGEYTNLALTGAPESGAYLLARSNEVFSIIDVATGQACEVPNVERYDSRILTRKGMPDLLCYLTDRDQSGDGTLRFVGLDCAPHEFEASGASLPLFDTSSPEGIAVRSRRGLVVVDPWRGVSRKLVDDLDEARLLSASSDDEGEWTWVLHADGQLILFDENWREEARFGDAVESVVFPSGGQSSSYDILFTDAEGLKLLDVDVERSDQGTATLLVEGACAVARSSRDDFDRSSAAHVYRLPCDGPGLRLYGSLNELAFQVDAHPRLSRVLHHPATGFPLLAYLREDEPGTRLGSLFIAAPSDEHEDPEALAEAYAPLPLGSEYHVADRVDLDWFHWTRFGHYALDQVEGETGRLVRFELTDTLASEEEDGSPITELEVIAEQVLRRPSASFASGVYPVFEHGDLIIANWDGNVGDLAAVCPFGACASDPFHHRLSGVPNRDFFSDLHRYGLPPRASPSLLLTEFDGSTGVLRQAERWPTQPQDFSLVAEDVLPGRFHLLDHIGLRGAVYLRATGDDPSRGRLEYKNLALEATGTIHENVSRFFPTPWPVAGILYVVPSGADAGIWFARAK